MPVSDRRTCDKSHYYELIYLQFKDGQTISLRPYHHLQLGKCSLEPHRILHQYHFLVSEVYYSYFGNKGSIRETVLGPKASIDFEYPSESILTVIIFIRKNFRVRFWQKNPAALNCNRSGNCWDNRDLTGVSMGCLDFVQ